MPGKTVCPVSLLTWCKLQETDKKLTQKMKLKMNSMTRTSWVQHHAHFPIAIILYRFLGMQHPYWRGMIHGCKSNWDVRFNIKVTSKIINNLCKNFGLFQWHCASHSFFSSFHRRQSSSSYVIIIHRQSSRHLTRRYKHIRYSHTLLSANTIENFLSATGLY